MRDNPEGVQICVHLRVTSRKVPAEFFLERNWILIRFAEEQVIRAPESCCKLIAKILSEDV